jgi:hypothetical protein
MIYQLRFSAGTRAYNQRTQSLGISVEGTSPLLDKKIDFKGLGECKFTWMSYCDVLLRMPIQPSSRSRTGRQ